MTEEQLRQQIVKGLDGVNDLPWIVRRSISAEQLRIMRGMRAFWQDDDGTQLKRLNSYVEREPIRAEDDPKTGQTSVEEVFGLEYQQCGWQKGPLPPNTWNWGGVVLVGETPTAGLYGFHFADFHGDHVTVGDKRIEADQIAWYNNCLYLPGDKGRIK